MKTVGGVMEMREVKGGAQYSADGSVGRRRAAIIGCSPI